jgi:membrane-associated PAP2 superfamily phosphatase
MQKTSPLPTASVTGTALALVLAWDLAGLDLPLARLAGGAGGFPWRDHWLFGWVLHDAARRAAWGLAMALSLGVWWPWGPLRRLAPERRGLLAASALAASLVVVLLKQASGTSCPWDLREFGGSASYASHWGLEPDGGSGHCFPAGHASAGFSFLGGYFAFRDTAPALARRWLAGALGAGCALGVAQQLRGAHFMSHTLWTGWICWTICAALAAAWPRLQERLA